MRLIAQKPVAAMSGKILGRKSEWHVRTNKYGTIYSARNGNPQRHPSSKQLAQQALMREAVLTAATILSDPEKRSLYEQKLAEQSRYKNVRGMILAEVLSRHPSGAAIVSPAQ